MSLRKKRQISKIQAEMDKLQRELNILMGIRFQRKRSLRAIGTTPAGARPQGQPRCRGRIFGCLPGAAPCECECACGLTNSNIIGETTNWGAPIVPCHTAYAVNATINICTLNLAAAACVSIMAALVHKNLVAVGNLVTIEQPLGTNITSQRYQAAFGRSSVCGDSMPRLETLEACQSLPAGIYTWSIVNRSAVAISVCASWIKAREITCA